MSFKHHFLAFPNILVLSTRFPEGWNFSFELQKVKHYGKNTETFSNAFFSWVSSERKKEIKIKIKIFGSH
jgi:hypothetical protein